MPVVGQSVRAFSPPHSPHPQGGEYLGPIQEDRWRHRTFPTRTKYPGGTEKRLVHGVAPKTLGPREKKANWNDNAHDYDKVRNSNVTGGFRRNLGSNSRHYKFGYQDHCRQQNGCIVGDILESEAEADRSALYNDDRAGLRTEELHRELPRENSESYWAHKVKAGNGAPYYTDFVEQDSKIGYPPLQHRSIKVYNIERPDAIPLGNPSKEEAANNYWSMYEGSAGAPMSVVHKPHPRKAFQVEDLPESMQHRSAVVPDQLPDESTATTARSLIRRYVAPPGRPADIATGKRMVRPEEALYGNRAGKPTSLSPRREAGGAETFENAGIRVYPNSHHSHIRDLEATHDPRRLFGDAAGLGGWERPEEYLGLDPTPSTGSHIASPPSSRSLSQGPYQRAQQDLPQEALDATPRRRKKEGKRMYNPPPNSAADRVHLPRAASAGPHIKEPDQWMEAFDGAAGHGSWQQQDRALWQGPGRDNGTKAFRHMSAHRPAIAGQVLFHRAGDEPGHHTLHRAVHDPYEGRAGRKGWEAPLQSQGPPSDWPVNMNLINFGADPPPQTPLQAYRSRSMPPAADTVVPGTPPRRRRNEPVFSHSLYNSVDARSGTSTPRSRTPPRSVTPRSATPLSTGSVLELLMDDGISIGGHSDLGATLRPGDRIITRGSSRSVSPAPSLLEAASVVEVLQPHRVVYERGSSTPRGITTFAEHYGSKRAPYPLDRSGTMRLQGGGPDSPHTPRVAARRNVGGSFLVERNVTPPPQRTRDARKWNDQDVSPRHYRQRPSNLPAPSGWSFFKYCA
mmetsp:Transcript_90536/g.198377  ORF Transcript_90536/g.198377 Transcript_90536/m.198377 type:complete len:793 (+) Transcript_90536:67-2445(+)